MKFVFRLLKTILALLVTIAWLLQGCASSDEFSSVLTNPSVLPCWFEICPNSTVSADALDHLAAHKSIKEGSIIVREVDSHSSFIDWDFMPPISDIGRVYLYDNRVSLLRIWTRDKVLVSDVIDKYGFPSAIFAYSDCADSRWLYVAVIYESRGIYLVHFDDNWQSDENPEIDPNTIVTEVLYYSPGQLKDLMLQVEGGNWPQLTSDDIQSNVQTWTGFGEIEVLKVCG